MNRADDRVMLTTKGAELLRLTVEAARKDRREFRQECDRMGLEFSDVSDRATQYDEVAAARERAARRRGDQRATEPDDWDARLARRHRFSRETEPDDGQTSAGPPPLVVWAAVVSAAVGVALLAAALYMARRAGVL